MIMSYDITPEAWTPITTAGGSASCWMQEDTDDLNNADVRIFHATEPPADADLVMGKRLYLQRSNMDTMVLSPDNDRDIYYARCFNPGTNATIIVDEAL